jgi:fission process protein 1
MKALLMRRQLGIAAVPALPFIFDEPIEHLTEQVFYHAFKLFGGPQAVEGRPVTGQKELRKVESQVGQSPRPEL